MRSLTRSVTIRQTQKEKNWSRKKATDSFRQTQSSSTTWISHYDEYKKHISPSGTATVSVFPSLFPRHPNCSRRLFCRRTRSGCTQVIRSIRPGMRNYKLPYCRHRLHQRWATRRSLATRGERKKGTRITVCGVSGYMQSAQDIRTPLLK